MATNRLLGLLVLIAFSWSCASAQEGERSTKWGKIPAADFLLSACPTDPGAAAMVLQDIGNIAIKDQGSKWGVEYNRHRRVKIFHPESFDATTLLIHFRSDPSLERLANLDAQIFYPNGEKVKIRPDDIFTEALNPFWSVKKIVIPNLQPGCILEYRYELRSEFIVTLYEWQFQCDLPTRWSEVNVVTPALFEYANLINRPKEFDLQEIENGTTIAADGSRIPAQISHYGLSNLAALKEEPFMTTIEDYRARIGFQLNTINYSDRPIERHMSTWDGLAKKLEEHDKLGQQYKKQLRFTKLWEAFVEDVGPVSDRSRLPELALRFVSKSMKWNGQYRIFINETIDAAYERHAGSSADLNLAIVALLQRAGVETIPVLVSTRNHGSVRPQYPFYDQFNSVLAYVKQANGTGMLLDATDPFQPVNELRDQHYNGGGWLLDRQRPDWIVIDPPIITENWLGNLRLLEDGTMIGHFSVVVAGPFAADWRFELEHGSPQQVLKKRFAAQYPDILYDSIQIQSINALDKPLRVDFKCRIPNTADRLNNYLYCKPVLDFLMLENPFKNVNRTFPVNFPYFHQAQYVLNLDLPLGYRLEEVPEAAKVFLPRDGGRLLFSVAPVSDRRIQLSLKADISQLDFMPDEYGILRQFFDLMVEKTQTQLVLKKS
jgi:hypothetical protein